MCDCRRIWVKDLLIGEIIKCYSHRGVISKISIRIQRHENLMDPLGLDLIFEICLALPIPELCMPSEPRAFAAARSSDLSDIAVSSDAKKFRYCMNATTLSKCRFGSLCRRGTPCRYFSLCWMLVLRLTLPVLGLETRSRAKQ